RTRDLRARSEESHRTPPQDAEFADGVERPRRVERVRELLRFVVESHDRVGGRCNLIGLGARKALREQRFQLLTIEHERTPGASPLDQDLDMVLRLEDAGASAIVMHSLFEEEIDGHVAAADRYLERLLRIKRRVVMPVIASLNGTTAAGWLRYAGLLQKGGAD